MSCFRHSMELEGLKQNIDTQIYKLDRDSRLTELKVVVLVGEDNAEPAGRGAEEGLTTAQHHLVSEETPP